MMNTTQHETDERLRSLRNAATLPVAMPTDIPPAEPGIPSGADLAPIMDEQGAFTPDWYSRYEELKPYAATLAKFHRPEALAKSYAHLERLKGYPGRDDARRMEAFRLAVGLPPTAEEYSLTRPENTPDEVWDDGMAARLAQVAYEYGIPAPAMAALTESYAGESSQMLQACRQAEQEAIEQADATLQKEWGRRYEDNMQQVGDFLTRIGERAGVDVSALMENPALRANADFARLMLTASSLLQEAPLHTGTPADDKGEAYRIAHDPTHPLHEAYMRTNHPQHRYANEQYDRFAFGRPH